MPAELQDWLLFEVPGVRIGVILGILLFCIYLVLMIPARRLADSLDGRMHWQGIEDRELRVLLRLWLHACVLVVLPAVMMGAALRLASLAW